MPLARSSWLIVLGIEWLDGISLGVYELEPHVIISAFANANLQS